MKKTTKAAIAVGAIGAAALGTNVILKKTKKTTFCPFCEIKKAINGKRYNLGEGPAYDNGTSLTPPMGWSSWNAFREKIDEKLIVDTAEVMRDAGLLDAGYQYVNLDDCWHSSLRDENGRLQGDLTKFPSGISALVKKINAMGFKLGTYSSNGTMTCEDLPASLGHEDIDAQTMAEWGIEFFKYDFCYNVPIPTKAPQLEKIMVGVEGDSNEVTYYAHKANLTGEAIILEDKKLESGLYVTGLDNNSGTIIFDDVYVEKDGEYVLTLGLRKHGKFAKFFEIVVNGADVYTITIPTSQSWSKTARRQVKIRLNNGLNSIQLHNPIASKSDSAAYQYRTMGKALKNATKAYALANNVPEKPIVFSICEWGLNRPWRWGKSAGNLWRTTPDIQAKWISVVGIYEVNIRLYKSSTKGGWNDPDMLQVGNGNLTYDENVSHFSLWCMMAAPLMLGNDLRKWRREDGTIDTDNKIFKVLTNKDMIAIDQDSLGIQCRRFRGTPKGVDILVKPLENKEVAICFFNKSGATANSTVSLRDIANKSYVDTPFADRYEAFDVWSKETSVFNRDLESGDIPAHGVKVFRVKVK